MRSPPILREMEVAVERANTVVTGLLDFAAASTLEMAEGDLNAVVENSLKHVRHLTLQSKVEVVLHLGENLPKAVLDFRKLEQVFVNLFTNACHAMPGGGKLTVQTCCANSAPTKSRATQATAPACASARATGCCTWRFRTAGRAFPDGQAGADLRPFFHDTCRLARAPGWACR